MYKSRYMLDKFCIKCKRFYAHNRQRVRIRNARLESEYRKPSTHSGESSDYLRHVRDRVWDEAPSFVIYSRVYILNIHRLRYVQ